MPSGGLLAFSSALPHDCPAGDGAAGSKACNPAEHCNLPRLGTDGKRELITLLGDMQGLAGNWRQLLVKPRRGSFAVMALYQGVLLAVAFGLAGALRDVDGLRSSPVVVLILAVAAAVG